MSIRSEADDTGSKQLSDEHRASPFHQKTSSEPLNLLKVAADDTGPETGGIKLSEERRRALNAAKHEKPDPQILVIEFNTPFRAPGRPDARHPSANEVPAPIQQHRKTHKP